jgi:hypothetical protein
MDENRLVKQPHGSADDPGARSIPGRGPWRGFMRLEIVAFVSACAVLTLGLSGCHHLSSAEPGRSGRHAIQHRKGHGPPAHAPAHGHRRKHHAGHADPELVFDSGLGVYLVVDLPGHYYWDGYYLRIEDGRWYASLQMDGGWKPRDANSLPSGLRKQKAKRGNAKQHLGRGRGPAKGR